jgi:hypothetical protein
MILNMSKSRRIVEVDEFRANYDATSGFRTIYAILRNGETISLSREFNNNAVHPGYGYSMGGYQVPKAHNTDSDEENLDNKDIWTKIRQAVMKNKPVSLPI